MSFHPDPTKQPQEVTFLKSHTFSHTLIKFNNLPVQKASSQKHIGMILDDKLDFASNLKEKVLLLLKITHMWRR